MSQPERRRDERPIGSGVTTGAETGPVPGGKEPVPGGNDPARGQPGTGSDTERRGTAGLGAGQARSGGQGTTDIDASDVAADDAPLADVPPSDALTQQDAAGAVDPHDPETGSRSAVRDAVRDSKGGS